MDEANTRMRCSTLVWRRQPAGLLLVRRSRGARVEYALPGGTPRPGESLASCARREVWEETGVRVNPTRVAFMLEVVDDRQGRLIDAVFTADVRPPLPEDRVLQGREAHLTPEFVDVDKLGSVHLLPPIAGHLRGFARQARPMTIPVFGNLWRSDSEETITGA
jgi:ADP-ribose pyrophosphatase YjhB (NUDIX family)